MKKKKKRNKFKLTISKNFKDLAQYYNHKEIDRETD